MSICATLYTSPLPTHPRQLTKSPTTAPSTENDPLDTAFGNISLIQCVSACRSGGHRGKLVHLALDGWHLGLSAVLGPASGCAAWRELVQEGHLLPASPPVHYPLREHVLHPVQGGAP